VIQDIAGNIHFDSVHVKSTMRRSFAGYARSPNNSKRKREENPKRALPKKEQATMSMDSI